MKPRSILCVCHGNICRSPLAEGVLKKLAAERGLTLVIESRGTGASGGGGADPRTINVGAKYGVPLGKHRVRRVTAEDLQRFELVLAMDRTNL